jgi:hypothetical protein
VLPLFVSEGKIFIFKFWFNGTIQDGMIYRNELFCRLQTFEAQYRAQVYHLGCKLAQQQSFVVITAAKQTCSLWGSLRDPLVKATLVSRTTFTLPQPYSNQSTQTP